MQKLLQYISERAFLSPDLHKSILTCFKLKETKKGEKLLAENTRADYLYFVEEGVLHNCYSHDGRQVTSWFYAENQFVTAWTSFYAQKQGAEEIICLEDCRLYYISYSDYQRLIADYPAFGNFARLLAEEMLVIIDEFSRGWSFLSAKEKYQLLHSYFPQIELRVKLGLIASFLGISQETLSRIRSQH